MTTYATDIYSGDGTQVEFGVTFKFIQRSHVKVYRINNSDLSETELTFTNSAPPTGDEYVWQSDILIKVGTAPTNVQKLRIERDTPENLQLVQWADGSYIVAEDLNTSDKQWLYNIQELEDQFSLLSSTAIKYRGTIDLTVDAAPANPNNGDFFINSGSGTVVATWTGIDGDTVTGSEQVIYNSSLGEWELLETPASQKGVLEVKGTAPIQIDTTDAQRPVVSVDAATTTDAGVITEAASDGVTYGRENGAWVAVANTAVGIDPPANPSNGDGWYDLNSGRLFLWVDDGNSSQWAEANPGMAGGGGASVEVDDTPPTSPREGDLWWDSSDGSGRLYVWYTDGDSDQWVEASPGGGSGLTEVYWTDSGTALSPKTAGRDVTLGAGDISATDGTFSGNVSGVDGTFSGNVSGVDGTFSGNVDIGSGNIELNANGSGVYSGPVSVTRSVPMAFSVTGMQVGGSDGIGKIISTNGTTLIGGDLDQPFGSMSPNITLNADGGATFMGGRCVLGTSGLTGYKFSYMTSGAGTNTVKYNTTNGSLTYDTSSARYKDNIRDSDVGLAEVMQLRSAKFEYKDGGRTDIGFIAEEVFPVIPTLVGTNEEGQPDSVSYDRMVSVLTKALQEAVTRIEALEAEVTALKGGTN